MSDKPKSRGKAGLPGVPFEPGHDIGKETRWKPGQSGNPLGLPKEFAHVRDLARQYTGNAVRALVEITNCDGHPAQERAAKAILDRAWGTPEQTLQVTGADKGPLQIDLVRLNDEQLRLLERLIAEATGPAVADPGGDSGGEGEEEPR